MLHVVVMIHAYGNRSGVRYMTGGLKVYYVPRRPFVMQTTFSNTSHYWCIGKVRIYSLKSFQKYAVYTLIWRGSDGPKHVRLEEMREKHSLQDRVEMLGAVPHSRVHSVLVTGHIFLNSSLTEAFCIAILEVSHRHPDDMVRAIEKAISILPSINPEEMHNQMKKLYSWQDVAKRTEIVYDRALKCSNRNLLERLSRYISVPLVWSLGKKAIFYGYDPRLLALTVTSVTPDEDIEERPDICLCHRQGEGLKEEDKV
ncbi:Glycosyl transferase family 1 [Arabidopsis suecica]|uniref:Glycosyl transferase family 1 n=1 Tax=Arabidopsis suecica TaxID=45249 RepID=A0A8T2AGT5_ARASU|nr:Glycosyl transferase family 1 [Arabidopsis suecica]